MKTNQSWGWLMAGVLAAGLNASYHDGGLQWAHRVAQRIQNNAANVLAVATGRTDAFLAEARFLATETETASDPVTNAFAEAQTQLASSRDEFDHFEVMQPRQQAQLARLEAQRARLEGCLEARRARMEGRMAVRTVRLRMQAANFVPVDVRTLTAPVVCPRVRVNIPHMPTIKMPAVPEVHIDMSGLGPA